MIVKKDPLKKRLLKKLTMYSSLTGATMLLAPVVGNATIIHTDPTDIVLSGGDATHYIDLDNGGEWDFGINQYSDSGTSSAVVMYRREIFYGKQNLMANGKIAKLNADVPLNNGVAFSNDGFFQYFCDTMGGDPNGWAGASEKFAGVKFKIGSTYHYGWIRVSISADMRQVTIHDWAYESDVEGQILTGDTGASAGTPGLWTGATSSDWNTGSNWDDGNVPTATVDVIIPDVTNDPVVDGAVSCKNITIQNGGILVISSSRQLKVSGNFVLDNGSSITNNGEILFDGSTCQLSDNRATKTNLGNVTVD